MQKDVLVIGLDLDTNCEVHVTDQPTSYWIGKGPSGNKTLVCLMCHYGYDRPEPADVPLLVKGRTGGARRAHFAHPAGQSPIGGHSPESLWHARAKQTIREWAQSQPNVSTVAIEAWTSNLRRRSDVQVTLQCGTKIAIEVQRQPLTDHRWKARHHDYQAAGLVDVWLWHPATGIPRIVYAEGQPGWTLDLTGAATVGIAIGLGRTSDNAESRDRDLSKHWPPCITDTVHLVPEPLHALTLSPAGLVLPSHIKDRLAAARSQPVLRPATVPAVVRPTPTGPTTPRGHLTLYPHANRPPRATEQLVSGPTDAHRIYRYDALPPFANPPGWERYICRTCGLVLTSLEGHNQTTTPSPATANRGTRE